MEAQAAQTGYLKLVDELTTDLINHGYGEMTFKVVSTRDTKVKVEIRCGRHYVFWIDKDYNLGNNII